MAERARSRSRERGDPEEEGTKLYIGNLSFQISDEDLKDAFSKYGSVIDAQVIKDRDTQRSRGFGFVTYANKDDAEHAIESLNGQDLQGRNISVNKARKRGDAPPRRGGGGFRGGDRGDRDRGGYDRNGGGYGDRNGGGGYGRGRDREDRGGYGGRRGRDEDRDSRAW